jgi:RecA-family ATPase
MPALANETEQTKFFEHVTKGWRPNVIIFDTRTAIFQHDTNDSEQLLDVNRFLTRLRAEGFAVIIAHHAGKNDTQRGRTDNDDILDLVIQLRKREGWQPGQGLEFKLAFEKVRYGDRLAGLDAKWTNAGGWERLESQEDTEALNLFLKGKSATEVAKKLHIGKEKALRIRKAAEQAGQIFLVPKPGPKAQTE